VYLYKIYIMEIYKITNEVTKDFYIGSAINFKNRKWSHICSLKKNKHKNQFIQNSWNKYGEDVFIFEIIETVDKKENLIVREQYWIDKLQPTFNFAKKAGSPLGVKHTNKSRKNMSSAHIGQSPEERGHKIDCNCSVCKHKMGENHWNYGKNVPIKRKNKISESLKLYYENGGKHSQKGKSRTKQEKEKIAKKLMIPILQYDLNNNFIKEWNGIIEAANTLKIHASGISACLSGILKTSGKFVWKYKLKISI
jgi:group I intron endonuclease